MVKSAQQLPGRYRRLMMREGVHEAERRIAAIGGATRLDLAGLSLTDAGLQTLRPEISHLSALTELRLENNWLTAVPRRSATCPS